MKKYSVPISITGFILQVLFFLLFVSRIGYWNQTWYVFLLLTLPLLLYNMFFDKSPSLIKYSFFYVVGTVIAGALSGIVLGYEMLAISWLIIAGVISGVLVATVHYHLVHLFLPGGLEALGFNHFIEVSMTFFSCSSYPVLLYIPFTINNAITLALIILGISILVGCALTIPIKRSTKIIFDAIQDWQHIEKLPSIRITIIGKITTIIDNFLNKTRNFLVGLKNMGNEIKTTSEDLSSVSEQMNSSLEEVSSTIQQISKGAQEQSSSISSIAQSIEQLSNLTSSISSQVKMASVSSRRTNTSARHGMSLAQKEAKISKEIFEQTKFTTEKMNELRDQATEIKKILDIIAGITEQTDLLALNAAIEAARVGEQGRGFAVIADEIRVLANETQHSSGVVENLLAQIDKTIQELSSLLNLEREKISESNRLAADTEAQFTGIVKAVDLITDMISRINQAATNQANNTKDLVGQVEQISQVAAETAASTEEVSASVQEQTASMEEFTSTAQVLSSFARKLEELLATIKK